MSKHQYNWSSSTANSGYVSSAGSTLLGSPAGSRKGSYDDAAAKYADDVELEQYSDARQRKQASPKEVDAHYDSDASSDREDGRLLPSSQQRHAEEEEARNTALTRQLTADDDGPPPPPLPSETVKPDTHPPSWSDLPHKSQLLILALARLSEPLAQTSLNSYMFYQLKSFVDPATGEPPSDAAVARQAGMLAAAFTGAQFCTAMLWGRVADSERVGRKRVVLIGLVGTAVGAVGFGFSGGFWSAVGWRVVGGGLNGNVGVMRTMISEIIREKRFQSRAFLLLPMTFNVGVIVGPLIGGLLADPVGSYPHIFGPGGSIGGKEGVQWLMRWPYALPNVVNAGFLVLSALALIFGLEETLEGLRDKPDWGLRVGRWLARVVCRRRRTQDYHAVPRQNPTSTIDDDEADIELAPTRHETKHAPPLRRKLPFRRIWTRNVLFTLLAHGLLAMHVGTFNNLWFVFLSTPRYDPHPSTNSSPTDHTLTTPPNYHPTPPFTFTGGLALPPSSIGLALAILGLIGLPLQLLAYPPLVFTLGTVRSYRYALALFPLTYLLTPFLALLPSTHPPPHQSSGAVVWLGITLVLAIQVVGRTFALPASTILVNNSVPHPSVLGTLHGIAQSASSFTRTVGPVLAGWMYGVGLRVGVVGLAWWALAGVAVVGALAGTLVWEGDGHEIWLEGEREEEEGRGGKGAG